MTPGSSLLDVIVSYHNNNKKVCVLYEFMGNNALVKWVYKIQDCFPYLPRMSYNNANMKTMHISNTLMCVVLAKFDRGRLYANSH